VVEPPPFEVVAVGSSAGGVEALHVVVESLPARFPAAVVVVQHLDPHHESVLARLLARHARGAVRQATHHEPLAPGTVSLAPPDQHLRVRAGRLELSHSAHIHFARPWVDLLFESVAAAYGARAIGVILTGSGVDGAQRIRAIKGSGGVTIAQDPSTAAHPGMPHAACATGCVDFTLPLERIGPILVELVSRRRPHPGAPWP